MIHANSSMVLLLFSGLFVFGRETSASRRYTPYRMMTPMIFLRQIAHMRDIGLFRYTQCKARIPQNPKNKFPPSIKTVHRKPPDPKPNNPCTTNLKAPKKIPPESPKPLHPRPYKALNTLTPSPPQKEKLRLLILPLLFILLLLQVLLLFLLLFSLFPEP